MNTEKFTTISIKKDEHYKKFVEYCKKNNLKKASMLNLLIQEFNKNPQKFFKSI